MKYFKFIFLLFLPLSLFAQGSDPFKYFYDGETRTVQADQSIPFEVSFMIPVQHHLYKNKMKLSLIEGEGYTLDPIAYSPALTKKDPFTGQDVEIFEGGAVLKTVLRPTGTPKFGDHLLKIQLLYQGCSEKLCFRQMQRDLLLTVKVVKEGISGSVLDGKQKEHSPFQDRWLIVSILLSFLAGLGSAFTPCVLPVIPITLAFIGVRKEGTDNARNFFLTLALVLSMAVTYAVLGLAAALLGKSLGFLYQNIYFLVFSVVLYVAFALSLFGLFELQLPLGLRNTLAKMGGKGFWGAMAAGFTIGFLAAPCVGPLIGSLLLYVAERRDVVKGFILLFSFGLGMGSLFLIVGTFYHQMASRVHGGVYTVWIKRVLAVFLLIPAAYYASVAYGHFKTPKIVEPGSVYFWNVNDQDAYARAAAENKPLFVDFFASWCLPCVEMETKTFSKETVQKLLVHRFIPLKIDCTQETDQCKRMVDRYGIVGWPTFVILNPKGEVIDTLVGKNLSAEELQEVLEKSLAAIP